jgi:hypothetical protein
MVVGILPGYGQYVEPRDKAEPKYPIAVVTTEVA